MTSLQGEWIASDWIGRRKYLVVDGQGLGELRPVSMASRWEFRTQSATWLFRRRGIFGMRVEVLGPHGVTGRLRIGMWGGGTYEGMGGPLHIRQRIFGGLVVHCRGALVGEEQPLIGIRRRAWIRFSWDGADLEHVLFVAALVRVAGEAMQGNRF